MAVKKSDLKVVIPEPQLETISIKIRGTTPIIFHKFSEKMRRMIWEKQTKKAKSGREERNPIAEAFDGLYLDEKGQIAFPTLSIKQAIIAAARNVEDVTMASLRGMVFVLGDKQGLTPVYHGGKIIVPGKEIKEYEQPKPENMWGYDAKSPFLQIREDMVRVGMGSADIRFRFQVVDWDMKLQVKFNAKRISIEQVINLIQYAGFSSGLGEWRVERNGDYGMFEVQH